MGKRRTFEALLETEFRWPQQGDKPFGVAADRSENAKVADDSFTRLVLMVDAYKEAADLMVKATIDGRRKRDTLVFPIIFNYRQFLELSLKYQLATFGAAVGIPPNWNTHKLHTLWTSFIEMLERYGTVDPDEADAIMGAIVAEFGKIDPDSYSHRYPMDTRGRRVPVAYAALYLPQLADVMHAVSNYFTGCDGFLSERRYTALS